MSLLHVIILTVTCPGLHHLLLINSTCPPPLHFSHAFVSLSALTVVKPGRSTLASGMPIVSHISVKHRRLHSLKILTFFTSAASSTVLLASELKFPINRWNRGLKSLPLLVAPSLHLSAGSASSVQPPHLSW